MILSRSAVHHMTELRNGFGGTNAQTTIIVRTGSEDYLEFADKAGWTPGADLMLDTDGDGLDERYTPYILGNARVLVSAGEQAPIVPRTGFALGGEAGDDRFGGSVSGAGDINGDGIADFVIGADRHDTGSSNNGAVYVVYGRLGGLAGPIAISDLTAEQGFVIYNMDTSDNSQLGISVSAAGDINGDGIDDLIVGASFRDVDGMSDGEAYVVYGKRGDGTQFGTTEMDGSNPTGRRVVDIEAALSTAGAADFAIKGSETSVYLGNSVSAAGDMNGDGIADLLVGSYGQSGKAHVIYGKSDGHSGTIDTASLGSSGFMISGETSGDTLGTSVSGAGDFNGDGLDDLIVGAPYNGDGGTGAGEAYVIYGSANPSDITGTVLDSLGTKGFTIRGAAAADYLGGSVSGGGDFNGDGLDDIIVGAPYNDDSGSNAGAAYVIYGKSGGHSGVIDLASLTTAQGFVIQGDRADDRLGISVSIAGDIDGDGLDDLIVGAIGGDDGGTNAGEAYVIYGKAGTDGTQFGVAEMESGSATGRRVVDTTSLTAAQGFLIQGDSANDRLGWSVSGAGDIDGDGIDDLIIGARDGEIAGGTTDTGSVYVLYGRADRAFGVNAKANSFGAITSRRATLPTLA